MPEVSHSNIDKGTTFDNTLDSTGINVAHTPAQASDFTVADNIGHTLMHFDSEYGTLYAGRGRMIAYLQGQMNGDTFQHIKDAKFNGVEAINNEIFDAKTHETRRKSETFFVVLTDL